MSARAAARLEALGFEQVFRYTPGKADWLANGWESQGEQADVPRAGDLARRAPPTCGPGETIQTVRRRLQAVDWDLCVVVNQEQVVLGLVREDDLEHNPQTPVEDVMDCSPRTYRLDAALEKVAGALQKRGEPSALVTQSNGVLWGVVMLEDIQKHLAS